MLSEEYEWIIATPTWTPEFAREIERVREYVATLHAELAPLGPRRLDGRNKFSARRGRGCSQDFLHHRLSAVLTTT